MLERMMKNVLDVPGVEGLSLMNRDGQRLVDRLPSYLYTELFDEMLQRVVSLYDTVDENFVPCDDYLLKYPGRWVHVRRGKEALLLILTEDTVNQATLRMVTNLLLKNATPQRIQQEGLGATEVPAVPAPTRSPMPTGQTQPPMSAPEPAAPQPTPGRVVRPSRQRTYRGGSY